MNSSKVDPTDTASELIGCDIDSCTGIEDDCCEDDDSDAEYNSIQRPAFVVIGEPNFDAGPAMDGFEYLRRVRYKLCHLILPDTHNSSITIYFP